MGYKDMAEWGVWGIGVRVGGCIEPGTSWCCVLWFRVMDAGIGAMCLGGGRVGSFGSRWELVFFISVRFFLLVIPKSRERLSASRIIGMPHLTSALWVSWFGPHLVPDLSICTGGAFASGIRLYVDQSFVLRSVPSCESTASGLLWPSDYWGALLEHLRGRFA